MDSLKESLAGLIKEILNPNKEFSIFSDQTIKWEIAHNIGKLDKLPDLVRTLKDFSCRKNTRLGRKA